MQFSKASSARSDRGVAPEAEESSRRKGWGDDGAMGNRKGDVPSAGKFAGST